MVFFVLRSLFYEKFVLFDERNDKAGCLLMEVDLSEFLMFLLGANLFDFLSYLKIDDKRLI